MSELKLTKTRLELLWSVRGGKVRYVLTRLRGSDQYVSLYAGCGVTAAMDKLRSHGWVRLGRASGLSIYSPRVWELTEAGEKVLEEHRDE